MIKKRTHKTKNEVTVDAGPLPQVAVVILDPHTGEVLALVGGRNYGFSQLDHAVAKRPTGSIFKPFVYAAAINTALTGQVVSVAHTEPDNGGKQSAQDRYQRSVWDLHPRNPGRRLAGEYCLRRSGLRAAKLPRSVPRRSDRPLCIGDVSE